MVYIYPSEAVSIRSAVGKIALEQRVWWGIRTMSAVVCGKRTSFFEDNIPSPPVTKRIRRSSSSSPGRVSPPRNFASSSLVDQLVAVFPVMDKQLFEKALEECGNDLDLAIKSLNDLCLGFTENNFAASTHSDIPQEAASGEEPASSEDLLASRTSLMDGADWVELFAGEMMSASNIDNARVRAARALEALENSIFTRATCEAAQNFQQETTMLKEQLQALIQENAIHKRAVSIQHERQKEFDEKGQELQQLKQLVSQYQEQLRTLEVNNYALAMHLNALASSSLVHFAWVAKYMPGVDYISGVRNYALSVNNMDLYVLPQDNAGERLSGYLSDISANI